MLLNHNNNDIKKHNDIYNIFKFAEKAGGSGFIEPMQSIWQLKYSLKSDEVPSPG